MKQKHYKMLAALVGVFLLTMPFNAHALITTSGSSTSGNITALTSILIPIPIINLSITESGETDFFGIAQFTIAGHDDTNNYNNLQITIGSGEPLEIPVPYGSFGLNYLK